MDTYPGIYCFTDLLVWDQLFTCSTEQYSRLFFLKKDLELFLFNRFHFFNLKFANDVKAKMDIPVLLFSIGMCDERVFIQPLGIGHKYLKNMPQSFEVEPKG